MRTRRRGGYLRTRGRLPGRSGRIAAPAIVGLVLAANAALGSLTTIGTAAVAQEPAPLRVLQANVGNSNPNCQPYVFKLCLLSVEERVAAGIAAVAPQVVALQEVWPPDRCALVADPSPTKPCGAGEDGAQVRRLLGPDWTITCADRAGDGTTAWDCIAVATDVGTIDGCPSGELCAGVAPPVPVPDGCDPGFQAFAVDAVLDGAPVVVANAHPDSSDDDCRAAALEALFADLAGRGTTLLLGDFNLDPYRDSGASVDVFDTHVGLPDSGREFVLMSGEVEAVPAHPTFVLTDSSQLDPVGDAPTTVVIGNPNTSGTIDHAAVRGGSGICRTLGENPQTARLDGDEGGMDHRALSCRVFLDALASAPPAQEPAEPEPAAPLPATGGGLAATALMLAVLRSRR